MALSDLLRNYLAEELALVADKIEESSNPIEQSFYFSAAYGAIQRVINIEYDPHLVLMHLVCLTTQQTIHASLQALKEGKEPGMFFDPAVLSEAAVITRDISERIRTEEAVTDLLERMSVLAYQTGGNGFYLKSIGRLH